MKLSNANSKKKKRKKNLCEAQINVEEVADISAGEPCYENVMVSISKLQTPQEEDSDSSQRIRRIDRR